VPQNKEEPLDFGWRMTHHHNGGGVGLDEIGVHVEANEAAENIRKYAEPLEGMCSEEFWPHHLSGEGGGSLSALLPVRFPTWLIYPKYLCYEYNTCSCKLPELPIKISLLPS